MTKVEIMYVYVIGLYSVCLQIKRTNMYISIGRHAKSNLQNLHDLLSEHGNASDIHTITRQFSETIQQVLTT